jgi:transposase-like protein
MNIGELKHRLSQGRGARGYPAELRVAAVAYAAARKSEGATQAMVAEELGVSDASLLSWGAPRRRGSLTPVKVVTSFEPAHELVVECGPIRIRGLDLSGVVELLRRLG